jgi:hypothetical protein
VPESGKLRYRPLVGLEQVVPVLFVEPVQIALLQHEHGRGLLRGLLEAAVYLPQLT